MPDPKMPPPPPPPRKLPFAIIIYGVLVMGWLCVGYVFMCWLCVGYVLVIQYREKQNVIPENQYK